MLLDVIKISPNRLRYKISENLDMGGVVDGDWDIAERHLLEKTQKHRAIFERYVDGLPWEQTVLFTKSYPNRFANGVRVRGTDDIGELAKQYKTRVDSLFEHMKRNGFQAIVDGRQVAIPKVYIARDGEILLGNQGNHRVAMAKVLKLPFVLVRIAARHALFKETPVFDVVDVDAQRIPAMTTEAERLEYHKIAVKMARKGAVIELGAWLGAATVFLAAAMRDAGVKNRVQVYDRFQWDRVEHERKAPGAVGDDGLMPQFLRNLGELRRYVDAHWMDIRLIKWDGGPIGFIVFDAPKRIPAISRTLTAFAPDVQEGTIMAWQDFAHFPSYEIVSSLSRLEQSRNIRLLRAVYPGTTAVFKVDKPWKPEQVTEAELAIKNWKPDKVAPVWERWASELPEPLRPSFLCGAALLLCDIGARDRAREYMKTITPDDTMMAKWRELAEHRKDLVQRYQPLFAELGL